MRQRRLAIRDRSCPVHSCHHEIRWETAFERVHESEEEAADRPGRECFVDPASDERVAPLKQIAAQALYFGFGAWRIGGKVQQESAVQLVFFDEEGRGLCTHETGAPSHEFQQQSVIRAAVPRQILNDLFLLATDGQAVLIKQDLLPIKLKLEQERADRPPELADLPDPIWPLSCACSLLVELPDRSLQTAEIRGGVDDRHPDQSTSRCC